MAVQALHRGPSALLATPGPAARHWQLRRQRNVARSRSWVRRHVLTYSTAVMALLLVGVTAVGVGGKVWAWHVMSQRVDTPPQPRNCPGGRALLDGWPVPDRPPRPAPNVAEFDFPRPAPTASVELLDNGSTSACMAIATPSAPSRWRAVPAGCGSPRWTSWATVRIQGEDSTSDGLRADHRADPEEVGRRYQTYPSAMTGANASSPLSSPTAPTR